MQHRLGQSQPRGSGHPEAWMFVWFQVVFKAPKHDITIAEITQEEEANGGRKTEAGNTYIDKMRNGKAARPINRKASVRCQQLNRRCPSRRAASPRVVCRVLESYQRRTLCGWTGTRKSQPSIRFLRTVTAEGRSRRGRDLNEWAATWWLILAMPPLSPS